METKDIFQNYEHAFVLQIKFYSIWGQPVKFSVKILQTVWF